MAKYRRRLALWRSLARESGEYRRSSQQAFTQPGTTSSLPITDHQPQRCQCGEVHTDQSACLLARALAVGVLPDGTPVIVSGGWTLGGVAIGRRHPR
jgi:hypothetical protein